MRERLYPLKINKYTTILVTKDKCTEEYRREYISRRDKPTSLAMQRQASPHPTEMEMKECAKMGMTTRQTAEHTGFSYETIMYYAKKYKVQLVKEVRKSVKSVKNISV